jgi:hypothetical protein
MGVARLLAKAWLAFCVYAGAHAVMLALAGHVPLDLAARQAGLNVGLFGAMGLLFGLANLRLIHILPGFDELVFVLFAVAVFVVQIFYAPTHQAAGVLAALESFVAFAVPGQHLLENALSTCNLDGGRLASAAFSWLLAFVFLGSALSRIRLNAALVRLERKGRPEMMGAAALVLVLGLVAVAGLQLLFLGTAYVIAPCDVFSGVFGPVLLGLGPLMLAYLIKAAITDLLALGPEA